MNKNIEIKKENNEKGANLVEYAFLIVLIVLICLAALRTLGEGLSTKFEDIAADIAAG